MTDKKKREVAVRSSAAEYLTFVASIGESDTSFEMRYENENIWLTQKMMAALYGVTKQTISQHINRIYVDGELTPEATVKKYLTVQTEGNFSAEQAKLHAETEYEKYRIIQDRLYESDFDRFLMLEQEANRKDEI